MTTPLTPWDQVQRFTFGNIAGQKANDGQWVDYDDYAALRARVEELSNLAANRADYHEVVADRDKWVDIAAEAQQDLSAVTKERDILKQGWDDCADKRDVQDETIDQMKAQLQALEAELLKRWTVEYEKALDEQDATIKQMKAANDMHGWNLYEGLRFGAIEMDLAIRRVIKAMFTGGGGT